MFGPLWERQFATITLQYRSGKRYFINTTVADARKRANAAIARKGCEWIKVTVPNDSNTKARVSVWDKKAQWSVDIVDLPHTKDS